MREQKMNQRRSLTAVLYKTPLCSFGWKYLKRKTWISVFKFKNGFNKIQKVPYRSRLHEVSHLKRRPFLISKISLKKLRRRHPSTQDMYNTSQEAQQPLEIQDVYIGCVHRKLSNPQKYRIPMYLSLHHLSTLNTCAL